MSHSEIEYALNYAKAQGVSGADVIFHQRKSHALSVQAGKIDKNDLSDTHSMGIRVIHNERIGLSYSESLEKTDLEQMVKLAIENSKLTAARPEETVQSITGKDLKEEGVEQTISESDKKKFALELESKVMALDARVKSVPYNRFQTQKSVGLYANSNGRLCEEKHWSLSYYTSAVLEDAGKNAMAYSFDQTRDVSKINIDRLAQKSLEEARDMLVAHPIKTGKYDVIFDLDAWSELFGAFGSVFSAQGVIDGTNPWKNKLNQSVASSLLTVVDHPSHPLAFGHQWFDSEGFAVQEESMIENGVLKQYWHNSFTANKLALKNNYRASRGIGSRLGVGSLGLSILAGRDQDLFQGEVLKVIGLEGLHSGYNFASGDFSFKASGHLYKDGFKETSVKEVVLSGNFYQLLNQIELVGDQVLTNEYKSFFSPLIRFSGVSLAGV